MPAKKRSGKGSTRDEETASLINEAILKSDVKELRRLACIRGLVSPLLRRTVWPLLLGIQPHHTEALPCKLHAEPGSRSARDEQTIRNDVARCLHESQIACVGENDREQLRETLVRILKAVVDGETIYYYQGLHEIAAVLLLQVDESMTYQLLQRLVCTQLRDSTRSTLEAVSESLDLLQPLVAAADPPLGRHLEAAQLPPFYAISWIITWFAHNVPPAEVPRLFDLFLASHPLMPMYLYVQAMLQVRDKLLALHTMEELHTFLVNFEAFGRAVPVNELAMQCVHLYKRHPPAKLQRSVQRPFLHSCAAEAQIVDDRWWVPEVPPGRSLGGQLKARATAAVATGTRFVAPALVVGVAAASYAVFGPVSK